MLRTTVTGSIVGMSAVVDEHMPGIPTRLSDRTVVTPRTNPKYGAVRQVALVTRTLGQRRRSKGELVVVHESCPATFRKEGISTGTALLDGPHVPTESNELRDVRDVAASRRTVPNEPALLRRVVSACRWPLLDTVSVGWGTARHTLPYLAGRAAVYGTDLDAEFVEDDGTAPDGLPVVEGRGVGVGVTLGGVPHIDLAGPLLQWAAGDGVELSLPAVGRALGEPVVDLLLEDVDSLNAAGRGMYAMHEAALVVALAERCWVDLHLDRAQRRPASV